MRDVKRFARKAALAAALALGAATLPATADTWPNGNIKLIIPSGPGGGFDTYGRILAKAMSADLGVQVVPQNLSGGAGMRGAEATYRARPDGQTFGVFNVPGIIKPLVTGKKVGYDVTKIDWIGSMAFNQYIVVVKKGSPYKTLADMKASGKTITFTGYGASGLAANRILCSVVGLKCQIITGYKGNAAALVAVVRGDAIASVTPITTATAFNKGGDLQGVVLMTARDVAAFSDTQKAEAAGYPALDDLGLVRAFGLPPGVKPAVRAKVEAAFQKAVSDPSVVDWAKKTASPLDPMDGTQLRGLIGRMTDLLMKYKSVIAKQN